MALIGYARVSTDDQSTDAQTDALEAAGCDRTFTEHASGGKWQRTELHRMLDHLREGDTLVVHRLDRLSRSLRDLLTLLATIEQKGVFFRSLTEGLDTDTPSGRMTIQILGAVGEFERAMIGERTKAGLAAAKVRGVKLGRRSVLTPAQADEAVAMVMAGRSQAEVARVVGCHYSTISRLVARARAQAEPSDAV